MENSFEFSIIINIDNCEPFLTKTIGSIVNQSIYFNENVEIIFIYHESSDGTHEKIRGYELEYGDNITVLNDYDFTGHVRGKYVTFLNIKDDYPKFLLEKVSDSFNKNSDVDLCYVDNIDCEIADLRKINQCIDFNLSQLFVRAEKVRNFNLCDYFDVKTFVYEMIFENPKVVIVNDDYFKDLKSDFEIDHNDFKGFFDILIGKYEPLPDYVQRFLLFEFQKFLKSHNPNIDSGIMDKFDGEVIATHQSLEKNIRSFLIYLKNGDFHIEGSLLKSDDFIIQDLSKEFLKIDFVEMTRDEIIFSASITSSSYPEEISVVAFKRFKNGSVKSYPADYEYYPTTARKNKQYLGIDWEFTYQFTVAVPVGDDDFDVDFRVLFNGLELSNHIIFREFAGLSNLSNYSLKHSRILSFKGRTFHLEKYSYSKILKYEFKSLIRIIKAHEEFFLISIFYRLLYIVLLPYMKRKRIWLFADRREIAGDNGEYLFDYAIGRDDGIDKYFIIDRSSDDFNRLSAKYPNVISFGSFKHKLLYLFSEKIMTSQVTRRILNPFTFRNSRLYEGVSSYDWCFLQHGVILHDLSGWIHKYNKNFHLFVTSSDYERDSIVSGSYNYDPSRVQVLGLSRYDHLEDDSKRQIVFAPTWRRNLNTKKDILNSDYLNSINSILNDERLIDYADEMGYELIFKPHPDLWKFIDLIDSGFMISEDSYLEVFKSASLLITDYSSIAFDFAYLKKPLIYYQTESFDEFHYGKGYFDYDEMGFGEVTSSQDELVDSIIEYIDMDCQMKDKYKKRVDGFFKYSDRNNSKRIYEWLIYK